MKLPNPRHASRFAQQLLGLGPSTTKSYDLQAALEQVDVRAETPNLSASEAAKLADHLLRELEQLNGGQPGEVFESIHDLLGVKGPSDLALLYMTLVVAEGLELTENTNRLGDQIDTVTSDWYNRHGFRTSG